MTNPSKSERRHPECRDGEVLVGYFDDGNIHLCDWKTGRRGRGQIISTRNDVPALFPVFAKREEVIKHGIICDGQFNVTIR